MTQPLSSSVGQCWIGSNYLTEIVGVVPLDRSLVHFAPPDSPLEKSVLVEQGSLDTHSDSRMTLSLA